MSFDVFAAALFLLLSFLGWRSGVLRQVFRVVAAVSVVLGTAHASVYVREIFFPEHKIASAGLEIASMFLAAVLIYISVSLAGWLFTKALHTTSDTLSFLDKFGGATVGAIKALLILYVFGVLAVSMQGVLTRVDPEDKLHLRDGFTTAFVEENNIIAPWRFPDLHRLHSAMRIAQQAGTKRVSHELKKHKDATEVLRHDAFEKLIENKDLLEAARLDRYPITLASEVARKLLQDEEFLKKLQLVDWEALEKSLGLEKEAAGDSKTKADKEKART